MKDIIFYTKKKKKEKTKHTQQQLSYNQHCTPMPMSALWKLTIFISNIYFRAPRELLTSMSVTVL